jgi:2-dehydropantoate 2-reductase
MAGEQPKIGVLGAGAIGCYVGGSLAVAGDVVLVGRKRIQDQVAEVGLTLIDLDGRKTHIEKDQVVVATDPAALADRDVVLCCVKSGQTEEAAEQLDAALAPGSVVVSLQNGMNNATELRARLKDKIVLGGIVGFNVVSHGPATFRHATNGPLVIEASTDARVVSLSVSLSGALSKAGFDVELASDIRAHQWSKLVMNLNNALSALSDVPTPTLLFDAGYRAIVRAIVVEALSVLRAAGVRTARLGPLPVGWFPFVLALPTALLRLALRAQLEIDPDARSSMWEDLVRKRPTEVDYLNGEIVRLAASCGASAPLNQRIVEVVHEAERRAQGSPKLSAEELWRRLS